MKTITVDVKKDGGVRIETQGFVGEGCTNDAVVKALKEGLGIETNVAFKGEYYEQPTEQGVVVDQMCDC